MKINFKKTYKFAVKSALYISLFATGFVLILMTLFYKNQLKHQIAFGIIFHYFDLYILFFGFAISCRTFYLQKSKENLR